MSKQWRALGQLLVVTVFLQQICTPAGAVQFEHGFDTVSEMLFGWFGAMRPPSITEHQLAFFSKTYGIIVVSGNGGFRDYNTTPPDQWPVALAAMRFKARNPNMKVLLYENVNFGPVGWGNIALQDHPEWWLRDDNGKVYYRIVGGKQEPLSLDWRLPAVQKWWVEQSLIFKPGTFDGLLVDGAWASDLYIDQTNHTMSIEHQKDLEQSKMYMLGNISEQWTGRGGVVVGNPLLDYSIVGNPSREATELFPLEYHWNYMTGTLDEMYGGFSTLNIDGTFNITRMAASIEGMINISRQGKTVLVRGYPGPCSTPLVRVSTDIAVIPSWPNNSQPKTPQALKAASSQLLDLALAPFLLVVDTNVWFSYAWFYEMNAGWVTCPSDPDSCTVPDNWYPEFDRPLGKPLGEAVRSGTVYTRQFEHASVYVDLKDRTASKITWKSLSL